jgi:hypothetical protein
MTVKLVLDSKVKDSNVITCGLIRFPGKTGFGLVVVLSSISYFLES